METTQTKKKKAKKRKNSHECKVCGYCAPKPFALKKHIESVHERVEVQCDLCQFTTTHPRSLKRHVRSVHQKHKSFRCSDCDFGTNTSVALRLHQLSKQHGDKGKGGPGETEPLGVIDVRPRPVWQCNTCRCNADSEEALKKHREEQGH